MRAFDASDVIYSQRVAPLILRALKDDGIAASYDGTAGEQVLPKATSCPDGISWMSPTYVAGQLGTSVGRAAPPARRRPACTATQLDSVSVGGATLDQSGSNRIPASPPPTFTVTSRTAARTTRRTSRSRSRSPASATPIKAQAIVPSTTAGAQATASVELTKAPPTSGPVTIKVTVEKVPGEQTLDNNTQTYTALFE